MTLIPGEGNPLEPVWWDTRLQCSLRSDRMDMYMVWITPLSFLASLDNATLGDPHKARSLESESTGISQQLGGQDVPCIASEIPRQKRVKGN